MSPRHLKDPDVWVLDYLRDETLGGYGWRRRGVRGWRLPEEAEQALGVKLRERLPVLYRAGLVERTRVEDPGRKSPLFLYRISRTGMCRLYRDEGVEEVPEILEPVPEPEDPEAGSIFVPRHEWSTLETMRRTLLERRGPERWGQHGWLSAPDISRLQERAVGEILVWLRMRGLVERRREPGGRGGAGDPWMYRVTGVGLRAARIDAVPILHERPARVQVRIRPLGLP